MILIAHGSKDGDGFKFTAAKGIDLDFALVDVLPVFKNISCDIKTVDLQMCYMAKTCKGRLSQPVSTAELILIASNHVHEVYASKDKLILNGTTNHAFLGFHRIRRDSSKNPPFVIDGGKIFSPIMWRIN